MEGLLNRLTERLLRHGLGIPSGATLDQIQEFERRNKIRLPGDMIRFLLHVNGMSPGELDPENHIRLWSLDELDALDRQVPEYAETVENAKQAYVIADYLIWSMGYVSWLTPSAVHESPVFLVGDGPPIRVAASFEEFLGLYIESSPRLIPRK